MQSLLPLMLQGHLERGEVEEVLALRRQYAPTLGILLQIGHTFTTQLNRVGLNTLVRSLEPGEVRHALTQLWERSAEYTFLFAVGANNYPLISRLICESALRTYAPECQREMGFASTRAVEQDLRATLIELAEYVSLAVLAREMTEASSRGDYIVEIDLTNVFMRRIGLYGATEIDFLYRQIPSEWDHYSEGEYEDYYSDGGEDEPWEEPEDALGLEYLFEEE